MLMRLKGKYKYLTTLLIHFSDESDTKTIYSVAPYELINNKRIYNLIKNKTM